MARAVKQSVLTRRAALRLEIMDEREQLPEIVEDVPTLFQKWGMHKEPQECMWVVAYDGELTIRTVIEVGRGTHVQVRVHLPTLLAAVLTTGCERFILAHNHPSNNPKPSHGDKVMTQQIMAAANACGLYLEDHYVICPNGRWTSFMVQGLMPVADYIRQSGAAAR